MAFPMDLRGVKAQGVDLLFLPDDIHVGTRAIAYADAAARYLECAAYIRTTRRSPMLTRRGRGAHSGPG
jgi:hypothetical protein